jgi:small subunit ribosomal protein S8
MSMQDPIADMLTRIRNAHQRSHPEVTMPASKLKASVAKVLQDEGYIGGFSVNDEVKSSLTVELKYYEGKPVIEEITCRHR